MKEQQKEGYLNAVARLAPHLASRARVETPDGPGQLMVIDLGQDSGYAVGVRREQPAPVYSKLFWYGPEHVFVAEQQPVPDFRVSHRLPACFIPGRLDHNPIG